jgi:glycerophosphoryl diester phosphodiesterase
MRPGARGDGAPEFPKRRRQSGGKSHILTIVPWTIQNVSLLSLNHVVAIAHRGGSALRPENTVPAFDHGVALGADWLECDVQLSRDGEAVVLHDSTLDRTTDATGAVEDFTADALSRVDAGAQFGADQGWPYRGQGIGIPTLRFLLRRYSSFPFVVEIKGDRPEVADRALAVIRECNADDRVVVAGFDDGVLRHVRRVAPHLPTSASRREVQAALERAALSMEPLLTGYAVLQVPFVFQGERILTEALVRLARQAGMPVHSWIVDRPEDLQTVVDWGVSGLISDRPDLAVHAAREANARGLLR